MLIVGDRKARSLVNRLLKNLPLKIDTLRFILRVRKSKDRESLYYYFTAKYFLPPTPPRQGCSRYESATLPTYSGNI